MELVKALSDFIFFSLFLSFVNEVEYFEALDHISLIKCQEILYVLEILWVFASIDQYLYLVIEEGGKHDN